MEPLVLAPLLGAVIGLALGMLGGGGSILTVPALVYLLGQDAHTAVAGARVVLPDGSIERLDPTDRICDSLREDFAAEVAAQMGK